MLFAADLAVMAVFTDSKTVLVVGIIVAGAFLGINNTLITEAVMGAAPVERPVASAAYSFVRFSGGAVAPYAAGKLGENVSVHAPFWMGAGRGARRRRRPGRRPQHAGKHHEPARAPTRPARTRPSCSPSATSTDSGACSPVSVSQVMQGNWRLPR